MGNVYLLDCTLRDGGYINDWNFGKDNIASIYERLVASGVDMIEVGFLDDRREFDPERTIMPSTDCVEKIFGELDRYPRHFQKGKNASSHGVLQAGKSFGI